ncbi:peptidylprolyl isomerase [Vagococcus xieshaowenii]|uniref:Foldase protein PrsA n=1 Tax=Vagococcus xieshaowenii TaxID=2562451 RepID=A0AAJ5EF70_9ENTE|nr:peptidylprolyl isomerase [Vagococcus xieshaowenii]QCA29042.1 peptidylprolyl isomerase [Vagococcus xieshaowenii]TFZ40982.1 peptidylprolyl isomerase [Vagococcus xieshaowenii]
MKTKKFKLAIIGFICATTLAACSSEKNEDVITMKGDTITAVDVYNEVKSDSTVQSKITNMILHKVAVNAYGDKVDSKEVDKTFNETKEQYGDSFASALSQQGLTEESYKDALTSNAAFEKMLEAHIKVKDADLKKAWADFHPEVETQLIAMNDEKEAKKVLEAAKKKDADFGKLAKDNSTLESAADKGTTKFDSTDTAVPTEVKDAAYKLKNGAVSDLIKVSSYDANYQETTSYYIVKMVKTQDKGNDMKPFKEKLTEIITENKKNDSEFQVDVISKEFKKANVKVKDEDISSVISQFIQEESTDTSTKSSDKATDASDKTTESTEASTETSK